MKMLAILCTEPNNTNARNVLVSRSHLMRIVQLDPLSQNVWGEIAFSLFVLCVRTFFAPVTQVVNECISAWASPLGPQTRSHF